MTNRRLYMRHKYLLTYIDTIYLTTFNHNFKRFFTFYIEFLCLLFNLKDILITISKSFKAYNLALSSKEKNLDSKNKKAK